MGVTADQGDAPTDRVLRPPGVCAFDNCVLLVTVQLEILFLSSFIKTQDPVFICFKLTAPTPLRSCDGENRAGALSDRTHSVLQRNFWLEGVGGFLEGPRNSVRSLMTQFPYCSLPLVGISLNHSDPSVHPAPPTPTPPRPEPCPCTLGKPSGLLAPLKKAQWQMLFH